MSRSQWKDLVGLEEGQILDDKYRIESILGVGGTGAVVGARHMQLDMRVAVKVLLPEMLENREAVTRFTREAKAAARIRSEHVARVLDVGVLANGTPYMVMEFLEGDDLGGRLLKRGPFLVEEAVDFVLQACVAVAEAHGLGIVHRDLKPANLFCAQRVDGRDIVKVLDFGISKIVGDARAGPDAFVTAAAAVIGSPLYMSPEQAQCSRDVDARTDIWALGVTTFELLTGNTPFDGSSLAQIAVNVATRSPASLSEARPEVPPALEAVVAKCLGKDPRDRYGNVAELAQALLPFAPKRSTATVEQIAGIIQAAGLSSDASPPSLSIPFPPIPDFVAARRSVVSWGGLAIDAGRRLHRAVASVTVLLAVAGFGVAAALSGPYSKHAAAVQTGAKPAVLSASASGIPPGTALAGAASIAPEVSASPSVAVETARVPAPRSPGPPRPPSGRPSPKTDGAPHAPAAQAPSAALAASGPRPASACVPNFMLDPQGRKHFKPECFERPQ